MSVKAFLAYVSLEKNYSSHTVKAYGNDIGDFKRFCKETYDISNIEAVSYSQIRSWIVSLVNDSISNRTVNRKIASLKAYYKFLQRVGDIEVNPLAKHKALKTSKKMEVPFSEAEMSALLKQISFKEGFEGIRDQLMIELLYTSGIRRAELIDLQLVDLNLRGGTIKVLGKRNKERIIPLLGGITDLFVQYLIARDELESIVDDDYVFLSKSGHKIYETLVYRVINKYLSEVSQKAKRSPHILRHTFATHLLNKGADLNSVKELLGHSSLASTQVYTHNSIAELKKVHLASHPRNKK
ncbi:MAG: tyrosine-type recombinase/integrase [Maribacter sp.]